jgi:hypothetical protein
VGSDLTDDSPSLLDTLTRELQVIVRAGLDRPYFRNDSAAKIPELAAVVRRLVPDGSDGLIRQVALAVRTAIEPIDPDSRREAAAILFATDLKADPDEDERGRKRRVKLDQERRPQVAALIEVQLSSYLRDPSVYEEPFRREVAHNLLVRLAHLENAQRRDAAPGGFGLRVLEKVARTAAALHYALLASRFVDDLHEKLSAEGMRVKYARGFKPRYWIRYDNGEHAFFAYLSWLSVYHIVPFSVESSHSSVENALGPYRTQLFDNLSRQLENLGASKDIRDQAGAIDAYLAFNQRAAPLMNHFHSRWLPLFKDDKYRLNVDRAVRYSAQLIGLLTDLDPERLEECLAASRRYTLHRLFSYYAIDEQAPLQDGDSLQVRAETYLDSVIGGLAIGS